MSAFEDVLYEVRDRVVACMAGAAALLFAVHPAVSEVVGSNNFQISSAEALFAIAGMMLVAGCST